MTNHARQISADKDVELFKIGAQMKNTGLSSDFISAAIKTAMKFEGVYDLVNMWLYEKNAKERNEIIADIQDMIDDCKQLQPEELPYIRFDDLKKISEDIRKFKDNLLLTINNKGGLTKLAELTHIPQPSLSRFFNSTSMPRRSTLLKIAQALKLDAVTVATEWSR